MTTEREYLELAAKAGGLDIDFAKKKGEYFSIRGTPYFWHAGLNSQQAFELADACHLMVDMDAERCRVLHYPDPIVSLEVAYGEADRMAINRLCIVRAAAEIQQFRERQA